MVESRQTSPKSFHFAVVTNTVERHHIIQVMHGWSWWLVLPASKQVRVLGWEINANLTVSLIHTILNPERLFNRNLIWTKSRLWSSRGRTHSEKSPLLSTLSCHFERKCNEPSDGSPTYFLQSKTYLKRHKEDLLLYVQFHLLKALEFHKVIPNSL